jgi:hypothetical protein
MTRVLRTKQSDLELGHDGFHVLTYAETGFSPLDIHTRRFGLDRDVVVAFAEAVNNSGQAGSLYPVAPISAVPRDLVRDRVQVDELAVCIEEFLAANRQAIRARRIVFDFRTPSVPESAITALNIALKATLEHAIDEVLVLEM